MNIYLERYGWPVKELPKEEKSIHPDIIVVIPCFKEPDILPALQSLNAAKTKARVAILVVINESEKAGPEEKYLNDLTSAQLQYYQRESHHPLRWIRCILPHKKAGVGLARKIGMDEAVRWLEHYASDGILACYDADCLCAPNYFEAIHDYYNHNDKEAGIVHYEHRKGCHEQAITDYELYLRYYVNALRWTGFPYAFQTLGSCITVKSSRYQKEGGMNTRKAGEDFYFLHKLIPNGKFGEIHETTVYPSSRVSDRVPFGTGHAIHGYLQNEGVYTVYHPDLFGIIRAFIGPIPMYYQATEEIHPEPLMRAFLDRHRFEYYLEEMHNQTRGEARFIHRFYRWLDGFKILKMTHFLRDNAFPNIPLYDALLTLPKFMPGFYPHTTASSDPAGWLEQLRIWDRSSIQTPKHPLE